MLFVHPHYLFGWDANRFRALNGMGSADVLPEHGMKLRKQAGWIGECFTYFTHKQFLCFRVI